MAPFLFTRQTSILKAYGNTLAEYSLVGVLLLSVCLLGLNTLGGSINDVLNRFGLSLVLNRSDTAGANLQGQSAEQLQKRMAASLEEFTPKEQALLEADLSSKIKTIGASGTTELLSNRIETVAKTMLQNNDITPEQSESLLRLANKGHGLAMVEQMVEDFVNQPDGTVDIMRDKRFSVEGQSYSMLELTNLVGFPGAPPSGLGDPIQESDAAGELLRDFQQSYQEVKESGLIEEPEVKEVVESAVAQIAMTGELVNDAFYQYRTDNMNKAGTSFFQEHMASEATHLQSGQVCRSGKFVDGGAICKNNKGKGNQRKQNNGPKPGK